MRVNDLQSPMSRLITESHLARLTTPVAAGRTFRVGTNCDRAAGQRDVGGGKPGGPKRGCCEPGPAPGLAQRNGLRSVGRRRRSGRSSSRRRKSRSETKRIIRKRRSLRPSPGARGMHWFHNTLRACASARSFIKFRFRRSNSSNSN